MGEAEDAVAARERLLVQCQQLLRARDLLLQRIRQMAIDEDLPVDTRLLAISRWTEPWEALR
jgi:hypothetical protein